MREPKRSDQALGKAPFAAAVAAHFLFEEKIKGPFGAIKEIFREQKAQLVSVGNVHRSVETTRTKFVRRRRRTFIVKNSAAADFVFGKDGRVQWDLAPIRESITPFDTETTDLGFVAVMFDIDFRCNVNAVRQTKLDLFREIVIGSAKMHDGIFVDEAGVNGSGRQNVSVRER